MAIYTKTGDKGSTGNLLGERVSKASTFIELQGDIDELNAHVGYLNYILIENTIIKEDIKNRLVGDLIEIQNALFNMGVEISMNFTKGKFLPSHPKSLEIEIDWMTNQMPPQTKFILYSGSREGTYAQVVRSIVRRSERVFVKYLNEKEVESYPDSYQYINRLSDFFFTFARYINFIQDKPETVMKEWK
ncbi:cob(I)yrinic acid a,c-diamide adenosyltransferase [Clostridium sp. MSJ-4]|uniref:Corrinoid adenosyltransferase n=1 Tax=Clostridium simiarum TaxID=2841506 RepID=A0ABS6F4C7_9CLOT|nr:cob(I)yrinic acid a,c-diamide adenosyltransferase [Clostridium simiarum]MBU5593260.1 cob(I)yrinic acid a,c-diamide adenosyltransferase [Clostridium simiarum]